MLSKDRVYLSTIDPQAGDLARKYGLGLEIAEFCTAWNMDEFFPQTDALVRQTLRQVPNRLLHGPFNELFPCAVDPLARELARTRFAQALKLAADYGAKKLILHGGYCPRLYYPCWYTEQSVLFWREFLEDRQTGCVICLENVLEDTPELLLDIVRQVDDPRLRLCLDVGHANAYSSVSAADWMVRSAPWLSHTHFHNNDGTRDTHSGLTRGTLNIPELLAALPDGVSATLELPQIGDDVHKLLEWIRTPGGRPSASGRSDSNG